MSRVLDIDGNDWKVVALARQAERREADPWHYARVRYEPLQDASRPPRETWLRIEEDVPARDVLDQYNDDSLIEAFLVAEEVSPGKASGEASGEASEG